MTTRAPLPPSNVPAQEKQAVALTSVLAAVLLTTMKMVVGILTGSLGILSEALHSALDLVAAAVTYFSVRVSDRPADPNHPFGHGKIVVPAKTGESRGDLQRTLRVSLSVADRLNRQARFLPRLEASP